MTSISDSRKKRGRPSTGIGSAIGLRLYPELEADLDAWIADHPEPRPSRPEAIRLLLKQALATAKTKPTMDERIAKAEQKLSRKIPAKASPERGVALMRKGLAEVEHRKLVAKQKTSGRKFAADPGTERRPDQATGKKGGDVQEGKPTRRALVANLDSTKPRKRKP